MPTLNFSRAPLINAVAGSAGFISSANGTGATIISGSSASTAQVSQLLIFKGSVPSFDTLTDWSTRSSDLLITFILPGSNGGYTVSPVEDYVLKYVFGRHPLPQVATGSGVATWFLLTAKNPATTLLTDKSALLGEVGVTGSGQDLVVPNTAIVSGNSYQSAGFYFNFPQSWTLA